MWCARTSKVNLFGWGRRVALGVFPNGSTGWILSHSSSSQGLFPPCRNVVIFRISYIFSELAKKRQPPAVKSQGRWPLFVTTGGTMEHFFLPAGVARACPADSEASWCRDPREVEACRGGDSDCAASCPPREQRKSRTASCVRPLWTLRFIYSWLQCERLHVDVNTRPLLWIYSGILTLNPGETQSGLWLIYIILTHKSGVNDLFILHFHIFLSPKRARLFYYTIQLMKKSCFVVVASNSKSFCLNYICLCFGFSFFFENPRH